MNVRKPFDCVPRYARLALYLLLIGIGTFVQGKHEVIGQDGGTVPGTIVIRKVVQTVGNDATEFGFEANSSLGNTEFSLGHGEEKVFDKVAPGSGYTVQETPSSSWVLASATCDDLTQSDPRQQIVVTASKTVTCTFVNQKKGTLIVRKVTSPDPDPTQQSFSFTAGGGLAPTTFSLKNGETQPFHNLIPGSGYTLEEAATANWNLTKADCSNNSPVTNITIVPGETVTCTFTNKSNALGLTLAKSDDDVVTQPDALLTYHLTYANHSLLDALAVVLTEEVPAHTVFVGPAGWACTPNTQAGATCTYPLGTVGAGATSQVEFVVRVNSTVPAGVSEISNQATVGTLLVEVDTDTERTPLNAAPDLAVNKQADSDLVAPGGVIRYTLTYQNQGNQAASGVVLTEVIPDHTTFDLASSSNGWQCTNTSCQFAVGTLAAGAEASVNFALQVDNTLPAGVATIVNHASIADDGGNGSDPTPANNQATVTTPIARTFTIVATKRDKLLVDADSNGVPSPGDTVEYAVTVRNQSSVGARALVFSDTPDANTTLLPGVQSSQGSVISGNGAADTQIAVALGDLAGNGATATIRFQVLVKTALPPGLANVENQGIVTSSDFGNVTTDDPDTDTVNDPTRTPLHAFAQLKATLTDYLFVDSDGNEVVSIGDILIYRLIVDNTGNGTAGGVQILDFPNLGLMLIPGSVSTSAGVITQGNSAGDATVRVDIPLLAAGARAVVSYQMRVVEGVTELIQNQATLTVQTGLANGSGQLVTDDPDISGEANVTLTPLGESVPKLAMIFLPLIGKQ